MFPLIAWWIFPVRYVNVYQAGYILINWDIFPWRFGSPFWPPMAPQRDETSHRSAIELPVVASHGSEWIRSDVPVTTVKRGYIPWLYVNSYKLVYKPH